MINRFDAFLSFFKGEDRFQNFGIKRLNEYSWPIAPNIAAKYQLPEGGGYDATVVLKKAVAAEWRAAATLNERCDIARFIIADWGRVSGNSAGKIRSHAENAGSTSPVTGFAGIASLSKVLAIADIDRFAILDARVIVAMNAISIIAKPTDALIYFYLPSRNTSVVQFCKNNSRAKLLAGNPGWTARSRAETYGAYMEMLRNAAKALKRPVYDLEMCLFDQAPDLMKACP